jgi:FtsH-binding integral membrane protein
MSQYPNYVGGGIRGRELEYESGANAITVAQFFNTVYAWMCVGLALTACVGWYFSQHLDLLKMIYANKGGFAAVGLAAFAIAWIAQSQAGKMSVTVATVLFLAYAAIIGALLSGIFLVYPARVLISSFLLTAGTFGGMSAYGFVTKRDLTGIGSVAVMLALGFVVASFVNVFLQNDALGWVITYAILVLFVIITAYDTQKLRQIAMQHAYNKEMAHRYAIYGSLVLYISFINLFISILRIMGNSRR